MSEPPEPPLRFDCPACGAVLTVPAAIAGMQGPCPKCWQEIVSPDPARGLPARLPLAGPPPIPTPAEKEEAAEAPAVARPRRSKVLLAAAIGIPVLALAGVGYHFGKDHRPRVIESHALHLPPAPSSPAEPETETPDTPPPAPPDTPEADAEAVLLAFLGAPDWQARSAFVLSPDEIRPEMEKHAREHGDGPIPASAIQLLDVTPPNHIFQVSTKAMPGGFPVPVTLTDEGPKIDWEGFIGFQDDHFKKFLEGPADRSGIFNLYVRPETEGAESPHYGRYRLSVPMPGREATGWVRKDSVALARLKAVFDGADSLDPAVVERLVGDLGGVPLVMALAKRRTNDGREFIEIVDLVAVQWGHRGS